MGSSSAGKRAVLLLSVLALGGLLLSKLERVPEDRGDAFTGYETVFTQAAGPGPAGQESGRPADGTDAVSSSVQSETRGPEEETVRTQAEDPRIDINTADRETLKKLPGIGDVKAEAIIAYREAHGPFSAPEKLMLVYGIGRKTFDRLKDLIRV